MFVGRCGCCDVVQVCGYISLPLSVLNWETGANLQTFRFDAFRFDAFRFVSVCGVGDYQF